MEYPLRMYAINSPANKHLFRTLCSTSAFLLCAKGASLSVNSVGPRRRTLNADGTLTAKVHYSLRGDNELLSASHSINRQGQMEGRRATARALRRLPRQDHQRHRIGPYATRAPFTVEYEITQPKFIDWSKKPVRIPPFSAAWIA